MKTIPRIGIAAVLLAVLSLSGCIVDPGRWGHDGRGRDGESRRRGDDYSRSGQDCRGRGDDDRRCRDTGPSGR